MRYLLSPDIVSHLLHPPEPLQGPVITFEAPKGWTVKAVPFRLDLKKGKLVGSITASDEQSFEVVQRQNEAPFMQTRTKVRDVSFGECVGKKYIVVEIGPPVWKEVKYALRVPGGCVLIWLSRRARGGFDESELEGKFDTLRLTWPQATAAADR